MSDLHELIARYMLVFIRSIITRVVSECSICLCHPYMAYPIPIPIPYSNVPNTPLGFWVMVFTIKISLLYQFKTSTYP